MDTVVETEAKEARVDEVAQAPVAPRRVRARRAGSVAMTVAVTAAVLAAGTRVLDAEKAQAGGVRGSLVDLVVHGRPAGRPPQALAPVGDPAATAAAEAVVQARVRAIAARPTYPVRSFPVSSPVSSPTFVAPAPAGTVPIRSAPALTGGGRPLTSDAAVLCAPGWTPPAGGISDPQRQTLLRVYGVTAGQVYRWDDLIPAELGGDPSDPHNVWPMTSAEDAARKDQLTGWLHQAMCSRSPIAGGPATAGRMQAHSGEYPHWWGAGGYDDPAAQAHWAGTGATATATGGAR